MNARFRSLVLTAAVAWPALAQAQAVVTSAAPDRVAVSVYRAPDRFPGQPMDLHWLRGFALVTEQRTVDLPAGRATVRFEGVAGGMLPESVIVRGAPAEIREKNLDADLLTPRSLYAHTLGRPVLLRRQHPKTGAMTEEPAIVRSSPDGGVILETRAGFEAANCGPLQDALAYSQVPAGLSPRPTLSIETDALAPTRATLSLSYLAWGFDWQTNYVLRMAPGARRAELSAWVTLASSDVTSFPDAKLAVVAGVVNREDRPEGRTWSPGQFVFQCYLRRVMPVAPVLLRLEDASLGEIVVTARRAPAAAMSAPTTVQEELGDLKLYRAPFTSTVATNAQKQVAMIAPRRVKLAPVYVTDVYGESASDVRLELHGRNRKQDGLGLPLPSGPVAIFETARQAEALVGEGFLDDKAVDEPLEISVARATQVAVTARKVAQGAMWREIEVRIANANPWAIAVEAKIHLQDREPLASASARLATKNGRPLWRVRVPANGEVRLRLKVRELS